MPTEEELKQQQEAAQKAKEEEEKKKKEEEEKKAKELEEEEKIKKIMGDSEAVTNLLEAKRKANAEAKAARLELEEIKKKQKEADDQSLKDQEKFKELAEKKAAELAEKEEKFKAQLITAALKVEAKDQGIIDIDLVKLIDTSDIKVDDDYNVSGIKEAVEAFKEKKSDFFKKEEGGPGAPPEGDKRPGLRDKILGDQDKDKISGPKRISNYFSKKK